MIFRKIYKCRNATTCTNSEGAVKLSFFPPPVSLTFMHTKIPLIIVLCTIMHCCTHPVHISRHILLPPTSECFHVHGPMVNVHK